MDWLEWEGPGNFDKLNSWVSSFGDYVTDHFEADSKTFQLRVKTLEGTSYDVPKGYMVIRGVEGEYYPCEPKIFEKNLQ